MSGLWAVEYQAARAFLFVKGFYLLLAADLWFAMVEHGGRYGIGGFNVSHFAWLDRLLPLPTPTLYVGLLIASGLIALHLALGSAPRWLRLLLAALYTASWTISLHDSYQHHYLLSWLLVWCAGYPDLQPEDAKLREPTLVTGWGFPMTAVTCAIVYTFTGISKCEHTWRAGHVLRVLTHSRPPGDRLQGKFDPLRDLLLQVGFEDGQVWELLAISTIALQWVIAVGYLAAPYRDQRPARWRTLLVTAGLLGSFAFHAVAELFRVFEIGLFTYYMLWIAAVMLAPRRVLEPLVSIFRACTEPMRRLTELAARRAEGRATAARTASLLALLALAGSGFAIPLPGAPAATMAVALLLLLPFLRAWRSERAPVRSFAFALRVGATCFCAWAALTLSTVPFDYYRRTAGELRRMGQLEAALAVYRIAERYAPKGSSRARTIRELEAQLRKTPKI